MSVAAIAFATLLTLPIQETRLPLGMPPAEENPTMSKLAPEECMFYMRWAKSDSSSKLGTSSTEQLMADPEFQQFMLWLFTQSKVALRDSELTETPQGERLLDQVFEFVPSLLANSGAVYIEELNIEQEVIKAGLVAEIGDLDAQVKELVTAAGDVWLSDIARSEPWGDGVIYRIKLGGDAPDMALGMRDGLLLFSLGTDVADDIVQRAQTPAPAWVGALEQSLPMKRRAMLGRIDVPRVLSMLLGNRDTDIVKALSISGVDQLATLSFASGFDGGEFVGKTRLAYEGDLPRMLMPLSQTPLNEDNFKLVPANAAMAIVANVDFQRFAAAWVDGIVALNPDDADDIRATFEGTAEEGMPSLKKVLESLDESMAVYYTPHEGGFLGVNAIFNVRDSAALREQEEVISSALKNVFGADEEEEDLWRQNDYRLVSFELEGETIHYVAANSFWSFSPVSVSWCLTDDQLILSLFPQNIKALLTRPESLPTLATRAEVQQAISSSGASNSPGVSAMVYMDSPQLLKSFGPYTQLALMLLRSEMRGPNLRLDTGALPSGHLLAKYWTPDVMTLRLAEGEVLTESHQTMPGTDVALVASAGSLLGMFLEEVGFGAVRVLSPVFTAEEDARTNLKLIGLAMHNYHDTYTLLPAAYSTDDEGKPLLSWRVHILPFLGEAELYDQFHLDEPWDSEHNLQLLEKIPTVYQAPGAEVDAGKTNYLTIRAENSLFPGAKGIRFAEVTDGTSNTIMVVEAADSVAVEWTRPDDLELDPMKPMKSLVGLRKGGFFVGLGDGSVWKFPETAGTEELMRWIKRNDGEVNQLDLWNQ